MPYNNTAIMALLALHGENEVGNGAENIGGIVSHEGVTSTESRKIWRNKVCILQAAGCQLMPVRVV